MFLTSNKLDGRGMALRSAVWVSFGMMSMGVGGTTGVGTVGAEVLDTAVGEDQGIRTSGTGWANRLQIERYIIEQ